MFNLLKKLVKIILIFFTSIFTSLFVVEMFCIFFDVSIPLKLTDIEDYRYVQSKNINLGYELLPSQKNKISAENRNLAIWTNSDGLRDREHSKANSNVFFRIAFLGDSVLMGSELQISELITSQLENIINFNKNNVEIFNVSIDGLNTKGEVALFEEKIIPYSPNLVVINYVRNDTNNYTADLEEKIVHSKINQKILHIIKKFKSLTWIYYFTCLIKQNYLLNKQKKLSNDNILEGLQQLQYLAQIHKFKIIIFLWPEFFQDKILSCEDTQTSMVCSDSNLRIDSLAKHFNFEVIRLDKYFSKACNDLRLYQNNRLNCKDYLTEDGMHPNIIGSKIAANIFYEILNKKYF